MSTLPTIVVAGVPNLASALTNAGLFPAVYDAPSTSALRGLVTGAMLRGVVATKLVFIVGDALVEDDTSFPLGDFLRKITSAGYHVIIVSVTPRGADLQRQHPKSALLNLPLSLNKVLYAIGTFGIAVDPVPGGTSDIAVHGVTNPTFTTTQPPVAQVPQPTNGGTWRPAVNQPTQPTAPVQPFNRDPIAMQPDALRQPPIAPQSYTVDQTPTQVQNGSQSVPPVQNGPQYGFPGGQPMVQRGEQPSQYGAPPVGPQYGASQYGPAAGNVQNGRAGSEWTPPARSLADFAQRGPVPAPEPSRSDWGSVVEQPGVPSWAPTPRAGLNAAPRAARRGYVITISVSKGGTGKSSMTLNLAAFLGMRLRSQGKTVCVIDANTQQADSGKYLDVYHPNVSTIVNDPNLLSEDRILSALVHRPEYNLSILLGPATPDEANPLAINPRLYSEVLELLKQHFDYIIIDTPVAEKFHEMFSEFALAKADYLIVPVAPNYTTLHNADNWLRAAVVSPRHEGGAAFDRNRIGVVLNRAEEGIGCSEDDVRATMANWQYIGSIPETKEWKAANNRNELVAPKNYADLSHSFAEVLHAATREPSLLENFSTLESPKQSLIERIMGRVGKR
jgi:MinD-like ATPase involved in chromosome partitioning or flagellar assembly